VEVCFELDWGLFAITSSEQDTCRWLDTVLNTFLRDMVSYERSRVNTHCNDKIIYMKIWGFFLFVFFFRKIYDNDENLSSLSSIDCSMKIWLGNAIHLIFHVTCFSFGWNIEWILYQSICDAIIKRHRILKRQNIQCSA
jgi:hypothetical protein